MKIAILGGGVAGLTAAYHLSQKGHDVQIIEKGRELGGLAGGFKKDNWEWKLERTYHHIFSNDHAILSLAKEINFNGFCFSTPSTASLFGEKNNYRTYPVDSPKDFLFLPELSFISKLRAGLMLAFLKISPFLKLYEKTTSADLLRKTMGEEVWIKLWEQLFLKKYGKYAENILASFIWARIHKRTQQLGYPKGGFQAFIDALANKNTKQNVSILDTTNIEEVNRKGERYEISVITKSGEQNYLYADKIISTLPYPITCAVMKNILGEPYIKEQNRRKYLFAINLILKTKKPILNKTYWLNVGAADIPIMCIVQHTNFVSTTSYGGDELCYVAWYVDETSELLRKNEKQMLDFVLPHLRALSPPLVEEPEVVGLFKAPYAQPIFDKDFLTIPRVFSTPAPDVFVANMDMTYPYDRGTNYAVKLGKDVSRFVLKTL